MNQEILDPEGQAKDQRLVGVLSFIIDKRSLIPWTAAGVTAGGLALGTLNSVFLITGNNPEINNIATTALKFSVGTGMACVALELASRKTVELVTHIQRKAGGHNHL
jgi:hypothetical protein